MGRHKGQDREQRPEGWGQHLPCPLSPSGLTSGLAKDDLGKQFTAERGSCSRTGTGVVKESGVLHLGSRKKSEVEVRTVTGSSNSNSQEMMARLS